MLRTPCRVKGNRLVKVTRKQDTDIVIQTAEYDGLGRRIQKTVAKSGDLDGSYVYYFADTQAGVDRSIVKDLGGWSVIGVVERHYTGEVIECYRDAIQRGEAQGKEVG